MSISQDFLRPGDAKVLVGDSTLFRNNPGWDPKYDIEDLLDEMMDGE